MGQPRQKDELRLTGIGLLIVGCGLVLLTCVMAVLMIDGYTQHKQTLTTMFAAAGAVLLGGFGCIAGATVREARRARAGSRTAPRDPDPD